MKNAKTILKIAARDLVNAKGFTLLFLLNLFLGISGFVVLHSFRDNINQLLEQRAKQLLSSDLAVSGRRDLNQEERGKLEELLDGKAQKVSKALSVYSMAKASGQNGRSRLVQLKAVEGDYPHYGALKFASKNNYQGAMKRLQNEAVLWLDPALLRQMNIKLGDKIKLGNLEFTAAEIIESDSAASWSGIGLAPKVYMSLEDLKKTNLVGFGSVATYSRLIKLKPEWASKKKGEELREQVQKILTDPGIRVQAPEGASEQVGRVLNYLSDYLGLVGLVALFLSGIGAGYLFQNYLFEKLRDVAILKSVGMGLGSIFSVYIAQLVFLSFTAVALANVFAWGLLPLASAAFYRWVEIDGSMSLSGGTLVLSFLVSSGTSLFICAPILYKMVGRRVKNLFEGGQFFRWEFKVKDLLMYLPLLVFMWSLAVAQARSFQIGSVFTFALLGVTLVVALTFPKIFSVIDNKYLKKTSLRQPGSLSGGLAARYFARDRLSSSLSICAIAIGAMLLSLIAQLETSLKGELMDNSLGKPGLFLFDIQEDQKVGLEALVQKEGLPLADISPMVRSRILKVNGEEFKRSLEEEGFSTREDESRRRIRNRGVNLSFRPGPGKAEEIVEGKPFSGPYEESEGGEEKLPELSLERRYAKRLGVEVGDTMTFDILGIEVSGRVANIRKVKWTSFLPNFFIVFQPGAIDDAPKTYLAALGEMDFEKRLDAQDAIVEEFPNVSVVNVSEVIEKVMSIFKAMALALGVMAALCMAVGFFVLFAIIQNQLKKKAFEVAVQKVFGMEASSLMAALFKEYFLLAGISCFLGIGFSLGLGILVSELFFDGVWRVDWPVMGQIAGGVFLMTAVLALGAGKTFYSLKVKTLLR